MGPQSFHIRVAHRAKRIVSIPMLKQGVEWQAHSTPVVKDDTVVPAEMLVSVEGACEHPVSALCLGVYAWSCVPHIWSRAHAARTISVYGMRRHVTHGAERALTSISRFVAALATFIVTILAQVAHAGCWCTAIGE